jgi:3-isopropylmalate dehydrogenase
MEYADYEIDRVVRWAFDAARHRTKRVASVDKANVLETSRLWREVAHRIAAEYPDVETTDVLVDNCAMQLVANPAQFDVLVTENTFGDILSDEASMLTGSLGMLASASLGEGTALYEPSHGSAPDIAGLGIANPIAQVLSVELMLRYSFDMHDAADMLAAAVEDVLTAGWRTRDIADASTPDDHVLGTEAMGDALVSAFRARVSS